MDSISFNISKSRTQDHYTTSVIINGLDLVEILAQIEQRQINFMPDDYIVGAYEGVSPFIAFHLHNHFLKDTIHAYRYHKDHYSVLEYVNSGIPGEHTVACQIKIDKDKVFWSDFKNYSIHLSKSFNYDDVKFEFDRKQYELAIQNFQSNEIRRLYV